MILQISLLIILINNIIIVKIWPMLRLLGERFPDVNAVG